jgi:hypothetical protein
VVKTLLPEFDVLFLFDHSCGHDRKRPDGLSAPKMNKGHGGAQPKMRRSKLESQDYLGPFFPCTLAVGDFQYMSYKDSDSGPFYLSNAQRENLKEDRPTGKWKEGVDRKKLDLQEALKAIGVRSKGNRMHLAKLCVQNNIPVVERIEIMVEGWMGKPKGMLQILWERGFIDKNMDPKTAEQYYTNDGKKDAFGNLIEGTSLRKMMRELFDFVEEETLLQYHARLLGVVVDRTPKCHPEIAGEGIEYSWGCAKGTYRRLPFAEKKKKGKFLASVRRCLDRSVLTISRQRKFSKRARQYMLAYQSIEKKASSSKKDAQKGGDKSGEPQMSGYLVEAIIKKFKEKTYKTHRSAEVCDAGYIADIVREMASEASAGERTTIIPLVD